MAYLNLLIILCLKLDQLVAVEQDRKTENVRFENKHRLTGEYTGLSDQFKDHNSNEDFTELVPYCCEGYKRVENRRKAKCVAGFQGENCNIPCDSFTFGESCSDKCQCKKDRSEDCSPKSGDCICKHGYFGIHCENECLSGDLICDSKQRCKCKNGIKMSEDISKVLASIVLYFNSKEDNSTKASSDYFVSLISIVLVVAILSTLLFLVCRYKQRADQFKALARFTNNCSPQPQVPLELIIHKAAD